MKKFSLSLPAAALAVALSAPTVEAAVLNWTAELNCAQEVPPVATSAIGSATGTIDTLTRELTWNILSGGFTSPVTGMHFHLAPAGSNGGVIVDIGAISGLGSPSAGSATLDAVQTNELVDGNVYINIHTANYGGGEIRGQVMISAIPLPATALLLVGALAGLGAVRRKQRAA